MAHYMKKKTFAKVVRGYSPEEVDSYIGHILEDYRTLAAENNENKKKLSAALNKVVELSGKNYGDRPSAPDLSVAQELIENAKAEAERIIETAEEEARAIISAAEGEARKNAEFASADALNAAAEAEEYARVQYEAAEKLYHEVESFRDRLFSMYSEHIDLVESIAESANQYHEAVLGLGVASEEEGSENSEELLEYTEEGDELPEELLEYTEEGDELPEELLEYTEEADALPEELLEYMKEADVISSEEDTEDSVESDDWDEEFEFCYDDKAYPVTEEEDEFESLFSAGVLAKLKSMGKEEPKDHDAIDSDLILDEIVPTVSEDGNSVPSERGDEEDFEFLEDEPKAEAEDDEDDFHQLSELFSRKNENSSSNFAVTDEFDIVYSGRDSAKNMAEIGKQPLVSPEPPSKDKNNKRFK